MDLITRRYLLTGPHGAGKTTFCRALAEHARLAGFDVAGVLSPGIYHNRDRTGILVEDLRTGETRPLASVTRRHMEDIPLGPWYFDPESLAWGDHVLVSSLPCDLIIIDEIGPLELMNKTGWQAGLDILSQSGCRAMLAVIRPELLSIAHSRFDIHETIQITPSAGCAASVGDCVPTLGQTQTQPAAPASVPSGTGRLIRQIAHIIDWLEHSGSRQDQHQAFKKPG